MNNGLDKNQHSVYSLTYHLVLVIKYRKRVLSQKIYDRLIEIFVKIGKTYGIDLQESDFESDHMHLLFKAKPDTSLMKFINAYKSASSRLIKKEYPHIKGKLWKEAFWKIGYFLSTTGGANIETIRKYIEKQKKRMKTVVKSYKIRIYPNKSLQDIFFMNFGYNRLVFNQLLGNNNFTRNRVLTNPHLNPHNYKPQINRTATNKILKIIKKTFPFLKEAESTSLQSTCDNYCDSFKRFFKRQNGYPKFKSRKNPVQSFKLKNNKDSIRLENKRIRLNKFGFVKYRDNREIKGDILSVTVKLENDRWYAVINCKNVPITPLTKTGYGIGIDLGLKDLVVFSDGEKRKPIQRLTKLESKIAKLNRNLSRKKENSNNFKKNVKKLNKVYSRMVDIRNDEYQKLSTEIVQRFDFIALETLQPKNMVKNKKLSHSISQISWSKLVDMIKYKAEWHDKITVQVDRFFPSSKLCNHCGYKYEALNLNIRKWTCPECNNIHDRDVNAAINILKEAKQLFCTVGTTEIKACDTIVH